MKITKETFLGTYAATAEEPTKEELDYIFSLLPLSTDDYDTLTKHKYCSVYCYCQYRSGDAPIAEFEFISPFAEESEVDDTENQRHLRVLACPSCGKWALCD